MAPMVPLVMLGEMGTMGVEGMGLWLTLGGRDVGGYSEKARAG